MRRLLITGGAGFIGGNFTHYWASRHSKDQIVVLDSLTYAGNYSTVESLVESGRIRFVHADIADHAKLEQVMAEHDITVVVHFAAESHVDRSIADPSAFVRTNVIGTQTLLDAARRAWFRDGAWRENVRFHHVSTDEVYGSLQPDDPPFTEHTPYSPNSPYAASKAGSDHLVRAYTHTFGLPTSISNCSNNYGPFQFPEKLIPLVIVNALHGKALPVYGDGMQVRDWLYVTDHCAAIERIIMSDSATTTYNVGGRAERVNIDIVRQLCQLIDARFASRPELRELYPQCPATIGTSTESLITFVKDRPGHDRRYAIDPTRIATSLAFEPVETFDSGLARTVDWYLGNRSWWSGVLDGSYRDWIRQQYGASV
ncbi:MAG: dTDP-glucose 4,6-dehydratase [Gemmatimonas sp.]